MKRENQAGKPSFVIVGAGPAGLILGILLSRKGYPTVILEREASPHRPVCGEYLSPQGVEYLDRLGMNNTVEGFRKIWGMRLGSPRGQSVLARFPEKRFGLALNRQIFQSRLANLYLETGGLLFYGETLTALRHKEFGLELATNNNNYICNALIGADGRLSLVAKFAGLDRKIGDHPRVALHCYLEPRMPLSPHGQMHILADGSYAGINPISEKEVNFSIVADANVVKAAGGAKNLINHHLNSHPNLSRLFHPVRDEKIKTTHPINCEREELVAGRITLIGDASGFIDPLTGEGITTAIKTAALLAEKIDSFTSLPEAFAAYSRARTTEYRQKEALNRALQKVIRYPLLCEAIALVLRVSPAIRSLFIGIIGNIYTPAQALGIGFKKMFSLGGKNHGQNSFGANRVSPSPALTSGDSGPAAKNLARSPRGAGAVGENFRR